ncbi:MAG: alpha/beta hydrolase [Bacteroidetes bacterium]|nr:alpha/beta hydrolase [Bacteroidota bacterium]
MERSLQFRGKSISYDIAGAGNPVVLLHGFIESKAIWTKFTEVLSLDFLVIAIDLPGHGESEVCASVHDMSLMADSVKAVLDENAVTNALIVGHSMGGYVALELGSSYPERVKGIVLFHSQAAPDTDEAKRNRDRTIKIVKQNRHGFIKQFIPDLFDPSHVSEYQEGIKSLLEIASEMSPEGIMAAISGMRDRKGGLELLSSASFPFLFIAGKQDSRIPFKLVLEQAAIPEHSEALILADVGHMGYIEAPAITLQAVRHFAQRCFGG